MNMVIKNTVNPLTPRRIDLFSELSREVDRAMNEVFGAPFFTGVGKRGKGYPLMDAIVSDNHLVLQYTVPGVKPEDLSVEIEEDENGKLLTVSGNLSVLYTHPETSYQIRELSSQAFRRVVRLPFDVAENEPVTSLQDGILKVDFELQSPKNDPVNKVKKLSIKHS